MAVDEKSSSARNGGLCLSQVLLWFYVLFLTGFTLYQFLELQHVKEEVSFLKEVCKLRTFGPKVYNDKIYSESRKLTWHPIWLPKSNDLGDF